MNAMQAGIVYGYVSLVDGIVTPMKESVNTNPYVIATVELSSLRTFSRNPSSIDEVDDLLTLTGLKVLMKGTRTITRPSKGTPKCPIGLFAALSLNS